MRGTLVTRYFAEQYLREMFAGRLGEDTAAAAHASLERWRRGSALSLGPATSIRAMFDLAAAPIAATLGFEVGDPLPAPSGDLVLASLHAPGRVTLAVLATPWGENLDRAWHAAVRQAVRSDSRWCLCTNALQLRLVDTRRSYARSFVEFDIVAALEDAATFAVLWGLLRAEVFAALEHGVGVPGRGRDARATVCCAIPANSLFETIAEKAAARAAGVSRSLHEGVLEALGALVSGLVASGGHVRRPPEPARLTDVFEQALTIAYRILFLLFAEARGLVPTWHPVYRRSYTVDSLLASIERSSPPRGLWETLQAISRLVHAGCRAGDLRVPPFNGRLFAPNRTPLGETGRLDDETMRRVLLALASQPGRPGVGRARIAYRDLGVEQLGAIYERVLDYRPRVAQQATSIPGGRATTGAAFRVTLEPGGSRRKTTGSFYTPRSITDYLVRRTLHPLVEGRSADGILGLRVLDPAMGSGAFLVSACRYLAAAHEEAVLRDGGCHPSDITEMDRVATRRIIAQRCLFGVDLNPVAVQLARLSIWLATLAADRPLTFLDHHLVVGDSLVGASLADLQRQPPPGPAARTHGPPKPLPLFEGGGLEQALGEVLPARTDIANRSDDSLAVVRDKEALLARLSESGSPLCRWKAVADLWCACWFWDDPARAPGRATFGELADRLLGARGALGERLTENLLARARAIARRKRFFHWTLEFPEVFFDPEGRARNDAGFDAVIGNPPWDMVRTDSGAPAAEEHACGDTRQLTRFARDSGVYTASSDGHPNRFQLFVERAVRLARPGGRIGLVLPSGLATDRGCAGLRRLLLERCDTEAIVGLENAAAIFPIHRSVRFLALTATTGAPTKQMRCRFGLRNAEFLDAIPDAVGDASFEQLPLALSPALLTRLSGNDLDIPDLRSPRDLSILERVTSSFPAMSSGDGWSARFGRELNASDDRRHLVGKGQDLPVIEGKQLAPFAVHVGACRYRIPRGIARRLLDQSATFGRARLAYRDVAGAANRLTLIAAIVPAGSVTTHTLFCLKTPLEQVEQWFLCGVLNSFVANYLVRPWVTTHVRTGVIARLPVPRPDSTSAELAAIAGLASSLSTSPGPEDEASYPRLQALVARLYRLTPAELAHVLGTFALVPEHQKEATRREFDALTRRAQQGGCRGAPPAPSR
jgi:Eco57I restriction-modification methylase